MALRRFVKVVETQQIAELTLSFFISSRINDFNEPPQSSRGGYASTNGAARGSRQSCSRSMSDSDVQDKKSRISFGRTPMQTTSGQPSKGATATSGQDTSSPAPCQLTNRRARSSKLLLDPSSQGVATSQRPQMGLSSDDTEYNSLIGAMDNDLDRPEPPSRDGNQQEAPTTQLLQSKGSPTCLSVPPLQRRVVETIFTVVAIQCWSPKGSCEAKRKP